MGQVKNPNTLEGVVHQGFHLLAIKHKIDVDKISDIIRDWIEWKEKNLYLVAVRKVHSKSKNYTKILRVFCPIDFYWIGNKFDGCDFDLSQCKLSRHQKRLIDDICEAIIPALETDGIIKPIADIPPAIKREFKGRF